jgi:uroporphyrinogen decarboxylase
LATYMVEGGGSKTFARVKALLYDDPETLTYLLGVLSDSVAAYLNAQIEAGAQAVMLFDTWGGVLSSSAYRSFSLAPMQRVIERLTREYGGRRVPVILFTKGGGAWLESMAKTGCDALGIDWSVDLDTVRKRVGDQVALQGNLDPCVLYAKPERIRAAVEETLARFGHGNGHVFNLGHGIHPDIDPEHVAVLVDAVHELSRQYHGGA